MRIDIEMYRVPRKAAQCWNCQWFFHIGMQCFMNPKCVGCVETLRSVECPWKIADTADNEKKIENSQPFCYNCDSQHPASYKGCKKIPLKPQFRKSYAEITKNREKKPKLEETKNKQPKKKISQTESKMALPEQVQLYQLQKFGNGILKITETLKKNRSRAKHRFFSKFSRIYRKTLWKYSGANRFCKRKALTFMDGNSKIPHY